MRKRSLVMFVAGWIVSMHTVVLAQESHMKGMDMPMKSAEKMPPQSALKPAEGASVKILAPKEGQVLKGESVPLQFKLTKGKKGEHVHAYIDGTLMGMFKSEKGTLSGIQPGTHTLELRVVTGDHQTELNATDRVKFVVQ